MPKKQIILCIAIVLAIALILRFLFFLGALAGNPDFFKESIDGYWGIARNILNNSIFSIDGKSLTHSHTPLYPLFLSLLSWLGLNAAGIISIQNILSSLTCVITIFFAYNLIDDWRPACLAGVLIALDIPSIAVSNAPLTETLYTLLFALSILYLVLYLKKNNWSFLAASGSLMGFAILCRPIATFFPFFAALLLLLLSKVSTLKIVKRILIYFAFLLVILSPWIVRNHIVFGRPFISTIGYSCFPERAARYHSMGNKGVSLYEATDEKIKACFDGDPAKEPVRFAKFRAEQGFQVMKEHPYLTIHGAFRTALFMLLRPMRSAIDIQLGLSEKGNTLFLWGKDTYKQSIVARFLKGTSRLTIILVFFQIVMLVFLWSSFIYAIGASLFRREYLIFWVLTLIILYSCITATEESRFRVPIVPFLATGSAAGIRYAFSRFKNISTKWRE